MLALQHALDFLGPLCGHSQRPFRPDAGVDDRPAHCRVAVHQFLLAQPLDQRLGVVGEQHAAEVRVDLAALVFAALGDRKQRQVMVAEHDLAVDVETHDQPKRLERLATAVDQITAEPESILRRVEADRFKQSQQGVVAALHIADGPGRH